MDAAGATGSGSVLEWGRLRHAGMDDEQPTELSGIEDESPEAVIRAEGALRVLLALLCIWTLFSGLALTFFQSASAATIGGGLEGGEGEAAQRLLGVHLLVLAPIYALLAWDPRRFRLLLWVPFVAQAGVVAATVFDLVTLNRDFVDGALPLIVATTFFILLVYVWQAGQRPPPPPAAGEAEGAPTPAPAPAPTPTPEPEPTPSEPEETGSP